MKTVQERTIRTPQWRNDENELMALTCKNKMTDKKRISIGFSVGNLKKSRFPYLTTSDVKADAVENPFVRIGSNSCVSLTLGSVSRAKIRSLALFSIRGNSLNPFPPLKLLKIISFDWSNHNIQVLAAVLTNCLQKFFGDNVWTRCR